MTSLKKLSVFFFFVSIAKQLGNLKVAFTLKQEKRRLLKKYVFLFDKKSFELYLRKFLCTVIHTQG